MLDLGAVTEVLENDEKWFYCSDLDYWREQTARLQVLLYRQFIRFQAQAAGNPFADLAGLVISEAEVSRYFGKPANQEGKSPQLQSLDQLLCALEKTIGSRVEQSRKEGVFLSLPYLFQTFRLNRLEQDCVLLCLAAEIDRKYEKIFAYLQDDVTQKTATVGLLLDCLCAEEEEKQDARSLFLADSPLMKYFFQTEQERQAPWLSKKVKLSDRILTFYFTAGRKDPTLEGVLQYAYPSEKLPRLLANRDVQDSLRSHLAETLDSGKGQTIVLWGAQGSGKRLQIKQLAAAYRRTALFADARLLSLDLEDQRRQLLELVQEALIQQGWLCFTHAEALLADEQALVPRCQAFFQGLGDYAGALFLLADRRIGPLERQENRDWLEWEVKALTPAERQACWEAAQRGSPLAHVKLDWAAFATRFKFTPGQIFTAWSHAERLLRPVDQPEAATVERQLHASCYRQNQHKLEKKAKKLIPRRGWEEIILPWAQKNLMKNAINQVRYRHVVYHDWGFDKKLSYGKGLSLLFAGPPGTGKTMAAEVIANELMLELYRIDLSQLISKYIGETEKNLHEVFSEASQSNAILFFDEADVLFAKRSEVKDSHDRHANMETAYLLQKVEEYEGISILATNYQQNIDEAFLRRINYVIKFPFPDAQYRQQLWNAMFPAETPRSADLDLAFLAETFPLAGGNIKNIVLSAAFMAAEDNRPIGMADMVKAIQFELQKTGRILLKEELGIYRELLEEREGGEPHGELLGRR